MSRLTVDKQVRCTGRSIHEPMTDIVEATESTYPRHEAQMLLVHTQLAPTSLDWHQYSPSSGRDGSMVEANTLPGPHDSSSGSPTLESLQLLLDLQNIGLRVPQPPPPT